MLLLDDKLVYALIMWIFGLLVGSFLNVCIYRIPKKEDIVHISSHCMSCGTDLHWYELIPLFSWLALRGRCRTCKTKISPQYPIIEASNSILWFAIIMINGWSLTSMIYCLLGSCLIVIGMIDFRTYEIPFCLNVFIACLGVAEIIVEIVTGNEGILKILGFHLIGLVAASLPMELISLAIYVIMKKEGFGGGDVKLLAAAGLLIGGWNIILGLVFGCILGSVVHVIRMRLSDEDHILAFGPYLAIGIMIATLFGEKIIGWYLGFL